MDKLNQKQLIAIYSGLFEHSSDGISILNTKSNVYVKVNNRKLELLGYTEDEYLNSTPGETLMEIQPDGRNLTEVSKHHFGELEKHGVFTEELLLKKKNGEGVLCELTSHRLPCPNEDFIITLIRDIRERKKYEREILERNNLLEAVFDNIKNGILLFNGLTKEYEVVNKKVLELSGYTLDEFKNLAAIEHFPEFQPNGGRSVERLSAQLDELNEQKKIDHEIWHKKKNGSYYLARIVSIKLPAPDDHLTLSVIEDITDRRLAFEKLEASQLMLKEAASISKQGYWNYNFESKVLEWSDEYFQIFDLEPNTINPSYEYFLAHIDAKYRNLVNETWQKAKFTAEPSSIEYDIKTEKGNIKRIKGAYKFRVNDGGEPKSAFGILQDISEQKQTVEALEKSEGRFRRLAENSPSVIFKFCVQPKPKLEYVSPAIEKMFGYKPDDLYEFSSLRETMVIDKRFATIIGNYIIKGEWQDNITCQLKDINGNFIWVEIKSTPIFNLQNEIVAFEGVIMNIDAIKKHEQKLIEQKAELETKNKELEQFTYITSHDLRSPVVNLITLLDMFDENEMQEQNKFILDKVKITGKRMYETLHDLIDVIAIQKRTTSPFEMVNLDIISKDIISQLSFDINESKANVSLNLEVVNFSYVRVHLKSILQNLLTNAIKYRSSKRPLNINISTKKERDYIILSVKDNGSGMDLNKIGDRLFGMFQVFHNSKDGKGLGLYIVKKQIEMMGGHIEVESNVDVGTIFRVYLKIM